jgi:rhodanese-related sulfurtransferase
MKKIVFFSLCCLVVCYGIYKTIHNDRAPQKKNFHSHRDVYLINVLDEDAFVDAHISGSIHVPYDGVKKFLLSVDNKDVTLIFYCSNYYCTASDHAAEQAISLGFKNVFVYRGGMAEWYQLAEHDSSYVYEGPAKLEYLKFVIIPDLELDNTILSDDIEIVEKKFHIIDANNLQKILKEGKL